MIHDIIKNDLFSDIKSEKLKTDIVFRMSFRSSKQLLQLQWFIYLLLITPVNPSGLIIFFTLQKHQVISSGTKQSHFFEPLERFVKSQNASIFPFKYYVVSGEIFFFVIVFQLKQKRGNTLGKSVQRLMLCQVVVMYQFICIWEWYTCTCTCLTRLCASEVASVFNPSLKPCYQQGLFQTFCI